MTTVRYMPSSHGISKRFRLNNEQYETTKKEIDEILLPVVRNGLLENESSNEYSYRNGILTRSDKLKDLHTEVIDSCIDVSVKSLIKKCSPVKVHNETEEKVKNSKETDKLVIKQTSNLDNVFKKPNSTGFNTVDHQTKRESLRTLSQSHQHASLKKDKIEFSIDSVDSDLSNVFNEDVNNGTELHNYGAICLEEPNNNNFSLTVIGDSLDTLKTKQLGQVSILQECQYSEVNTAKNSDESKSENVKISEVSKLEKNKTKSEVYYSNAYKMFSNVIQKARKKVKQSTNNSQPSIGITGKNAQLENENPLLETGNSLLKNPFTQGGCSRLRVGDYTDNLRSVLYDMDELGEFLESFQLELLHMMSHLSAVKQILHFLSVQAEYIEIVLQNVQIRYLAKQVGKLSKKNLETAVGSYNVIQNFGHSLLDNVIKSGKFLGPAIDKYKSSLDIVLRTFFKSFSTSIDTESTLIDYPDIVIAAFNEVTTQIEQAKAIQCQVITLCHTESPQIENIRECVTILMNLSNNTSF